LAARPADPDVQQACRLLLERLLLQHEYARAEALGQRLVGLAPDAASYAALGKALYSLNRQADAEKAFGKALALWPAHAEALCLLGLALRDQGRFEEALKALRRGHTLGSRTRGWPLPSGQWIRGIERLAEMEKRLAAILAGKQKTSGVKETMDYAAF